jgi:hypothetical protein
MCKFVYGSVEHQKEVVGLIGYDWKNWNANDENQNLLLFRKAMDAMLSGKDINGKMLSVDDLNLLSDITGR